METLVNEMVQPPVFCRTQSVTVNVSPKNGLLIDALAKTGFCLKRYRKGSKEGGMGIYEWSMDMPFAGSYHEHRERQILTMGRQNSRRCISLRHCVFRRKVLCSFAVIVLLYVSCIPRFTVDLGRWGVRFNRQL